MKFLRNKIDEMTKHYQDRTIFSKVLIGYLALSLALVILTTSLTWVLLRQYTFAANMNELMQKAEAAANVFEHSDTMTYEGVLDIERLADAKLLYIDAAFNARRGSTYVDIGEVNEKWDDYPIALGEEDRSIIERVIVNGSEEKAVRRLNVLGCDALFAVVPVRNANDDIEGALILYRRQGDVSGVAASTALILIVALAAASLISAILAFGLSRHITQPLAVLTKTVCHMSKGQFGERITVTQKDEIGRLAETFNRMSDRLAQTIFDLKNEKAKLEQILAGIGEGIVAVDQDGMLLHHNNAALALLEITSLKGSDEETHTAHLLDMLRRVTLTGKREQFQWKSSKSRSIYAGVWPVMSAEGGVIGAVGLLRDVSEEERLEQLRRDYVANISHELRTPLTGIRGMVEPLLDGYIETDAEKMDCYQIIYQETMRLEKLIGEMLDMSRLQSGRLTVELEPMDVRGILNGAVLRLKERAAKQNIDLRTVLPETLPYVMGNENRIMQVLIILLDNALAFTPEGGRIEVYAKNAGEQVLVGVRDNGVGIDPCDLPYIWERFYKADKSRMGTPGTGLGLAIAKLVCELMNGRIEVQSEPGKGAQFEFSLNVIDVRDETGIDR